MSKAATSRRRIEENAPSPDTGEEENWLDASESAAMNFDGVYDYLIVGGGSAGCVLAYRLSEDPANKVCLLEAGPRDAWWNWKNHMPAALLYNLMDDKYNWYYHTEPQPYMNDRVMYWRRGRVLGGSSSPNALVYIRGPPL